MDRLTMVDANELCLYWLESPPTHVSVAGIARAFGGGKPSTRMTEGAPRTPMPRVGTDEEAEMYSEQMKYFVQGIKARN